jgi:putative hydrolase of the HAD superfamily
MEQYERGEISTEHFVSTILEHAKAGTTREDVIAAWNAMHGGIPAERLQHIRQWKDAGHRLFLLSNNNDLHWHDVFSHYDMSMFEHCFASHLLHVSKPDPKIYQLVDNQLHKWNCEEPFHFVDDILINRQTAQELGWQTYETIYDAPLLDSISTASV